MTPTLTLTHYYNMILESIMSYWFGKVTGNSGGIGGGDGVMGGNGGCIHKIYHKLGL